MIERFITSVCWVVGPITSLAVLVLWLHKESVKTSVLVVVGLADLWLFVRYFV